MPRSAPSSVTRIVCTDEPLAIKSYAAMVSESLDALAKLRHEMRAQLAHGGHA